LVWKKQTRPCRTGRRQMGGEGDEKPDVVVKNAHATVRRKEWVQMWKRATCDAKHRVIPRPRGGTKKGEWFGKGEASQKENKNGL